MDIAGLRVQHDELEELVAKFAAMVEQDRPQKVAGIRWRLARVLIAHLSVEDYFLYPAMQAAGGHASYMAGLFQTGNGRSGAAIHGVYEPLDRSGHSGKLGALSIGNGRYSADAQPSYPAGERNLIPACSCRMAGRADGGGGDVCAEPARSRSA